MNYYMLSKVCADTGHKVFVYDYMTTSERSKMIRKGWRSE